MIEIKETGPEDLANVQRLWADKDVMRYIEGFPEGLHRTDEEMRQWLEWIVSGRPQRNHFSIYEGGEYCGESFYSIDPERGNSASVDIKLFASARGRGLATGGLLNAIDKAFFYGAESVWVDPDRENERAIALYERLGFVEKEMPEYLLAQDEDPAKHRYMELAKGDLRAGCCGGK